MFNNPFLKKDPLLEAVRGAMQDGETRRQAEAIVNEHFGVYSRKAVVREHLAAYDAAIEEVYADLKEGVQIDELYGKGRLKDIKHARSKETYKAMKKAEKASDVEHDERGYRTGPSREDKAYGAAKHREEKADMVAQKLKHHRKKMGFNEELAKKDYDKDGKIETPKDEVWGSRLRAAKKAGKMEEGLADTIRSMNPFAKVGDALSTGPAKAAPDTRIMGNPDTAKKPTPSTPPKDGSSSSPFPANEETQIDEISNKTKGAYLGSAVADLTARSQHYGGINVGARAGKFGRDLARKIKNRQIGIANATKDIREEEQIDERNLLKRMKDTMRLGSSGKERVDRISGALSDRGGNWDFKKGDFTEKGKSQVKSRLKNVKGASDYALNKEETQIDELSRNTLKSYVKKASKDLRKTAHEAGKESEADDYWGREGKSRYDRKPLRKSGKRLRGIQKATDRLEENQMDEAAYSAKAARAGKDIGKPGKSFSKIAKSAGERYGSEERGKKVAGAILKRIRAKHMKEEQSFNAALLNAGKSVIKEFVDTRAGATPIRPFVPTQNGMMGGMPNAPTSPAGKTQVISPFVPGPAGMSGGKDLPGSNLPAPTPLPKINVAGAPKAAAKAEPTSFKAAFAAARKEAEKIGNKATGQFTWHGKQYQTNIKGTGTGAKPQEKYVAPTQQKVTSVGKSEPAAKQSTVSNNPPSAPAPATAAATPAPAGAPAPSAPAAAPSAPATAAASTPSVKTDNLPKTPAAAPTPVTGTNPVNTQSDADNKKAKGSVTSMPGSVNETCVNKYTVKEDRKRVLNKAKVLKANQTETGKPADPVELDPVKQGMQNQSLTN